MKIHEIKTDYETVERHLDNWARWMRHDNHRLGYPSRAAVIRAGGVAFEGMFEEICDKLDKHAAEVMDCLVHDLPLHQRGAVYHKWLGAVIRVRDQEQYLLDAYLCLDKGIRIRGLV